jgi:hypothetical protein
MQYEKYDTNNTIDTAECIGLKVAHPFTQKLHSGIQKQFGNCHKTVAHLHVFTPHNTQILQYYCK